MTEFHKLLVDVYLSDLKHDFKVSDLNLQTINNINIPESILESYLSKKTKSNTQVKLNTAKILSEDDLLFKYITIVSDDLLICKKEIKQHFLDTKFTILDYLLYIIQQRKDNISVNVGFNNYNVSVFDLETQIPSTTEDEIPFVLLPDMTRINLLSIIKLYSSINYIGSTTPMIFDSNNITGHNFNINKSKLLKNSKNFQSVKPHSLTPVTDYSQFKIYGITSTNTINNSLNPRNDNTALLTKLLLTNIDIFINSNKDEKELTITLKNVKLLDKKFIDITVPGFLSNSNFMNRFNKKNTNIKLTDNLSLNYLILKQINMLCKRLSDSCQSLYCASDYFNKMLTHKKQKLEPLFYTEDRISLLQSLIFGAKHILTHSKTKFILFTLSEQDIEQKNDILHYFNELNTSTNNVHNTNNISNNTHYNRNTIKSNINNNLNASFMGGAKSGNTIKAVTTPYRSFLQSPRRVKQFTPGISQGKTINPSKRRLLLSTPRDKYKTRVRTSKRSHDNSNLNNSINSKLITLTNILKQLINTGTYDNINITNVLSFNYNSITNNIEIKDNFFKPISNYYNLINTDNINNIDLTLFLIDPYDYIKNKYNLYDCEMITQKVKKLSRQLLSILNKNKLRLTKKKR